MTDTNRHIVEFLDYYINSVRNSEYAILINGAWGSGKTYFVRKIQEKHETKKIKFLYVSLYGVKNTSEIEDQFFQQLYPILSSKPMKIVSKLFKEFIKTKVMVDINIKSFLKIPNGHILIFDDLERCELPIVNVLGYINHYVEHKGHKVILIASEKEIKQKEKYKRIKEKLVGKTFEIESPRVHRRLFCLSHAALLDSVC